MFTTRFSPELAKEYGMSESVLFLYIADRVRMREKAVRHFYKGAGWVRSTLREFSRCFPCWSAGTIQRSLTNLKKKHLIRSTRLGPGDRTNWYMLTEKGRKTLIGLSE